MNHRCMAKCTYDSCFGGEKCWIRNTLGFIIFFDDEALVHKKTNWVYFHPTPLSQENLLLELENLYIESIGKAYQTVLCNVLQDYA